MKNLSDFNLKANPFRVTPAQKSDELIWAGFHTIEMRLKNRIVRSLLTQNSSFVLNYGEFGSGKTHASRYFSKADVISGIAEETGKKTYFPLVISFPKSKQPISDIYSQIIDKLDIATIRELLKDEDINDIMADVIDSEYIRLVMKALLNPDVEASLMQRFLYRSISSQDMKCMMDHGVQRGLSSDNDLTDVISALFSMLTYEKRCYSSVVMWIDEFEDITILNSVNIASVNSFLRSLIDKTPNNLLLFLNLTQTATLDRSELADYLNPAVMERVKEVIEFGLPTCESLKEYLVELLNNQINREQPREDFYPFDDDVVDSLVADLKDAPLRRFNEAFSVLLENALVDDVEKIDRDFYIRYKNEAIGWRG